ncbi:MAG TPA: 4-hydroxy-tetrahydrodipicolinate reductase [Planctomycetaceae bacterium]|nr:4-hydroxy-tetrahydrodipicolinate reductase [Planctomycetaceae bacterium]
MPPVRVAINGAAGRMGQRLVALISQDRQLKLVAAIDVPGHARLGQDAGQIAGVGPLDVALSDALSVEADAVIDFSLPDGAEAVVRVCRDKKVPLVLATTGLEPPQVEAIREAAKAIPLLWAPNMSLAVNLTMKLAAVAAAALKGQDADVEILERHHRYKADSPSGTALKFGQIIAGEMGQTETRHGREGRVGERPHGEIGYHAIRVGDNPGEHTIVFGMLGETVELTVRATNRDCYALGALAAAKFLVGKPAGMYSMADVLGL